MTGPDRYYQGLADLHIIAATLATHGERLSSSKRDRDDLALMARVAARCIARGPVRYHHVIEECDGIQAVWRQFAG